MQSVVVYCVDARTHTLRRMGSVVSVIMSTSTTNSLGNGEDGSLTVTVA